MAVLNEKDFFDKVNAIIGDSSSDEAISFLEDMQDTYGDMKKRIEDAQGTDWKKRYEENDALWRAKYKHRFYSGAQGTPDEVEDDEEIKALKHAEQVTIDDLFKDDGTGKEIK